LYKFKLFAIVFGIFRDLKQTGTGGYENLR
jgi:hypothetical protein